MKRKISMVLALVASLAMVSACGGGGGGGGGGTDTDVCGGTTKGCVTGVVQDSTGAVITTGVTVTSEVATAAAQTLKAATDLATTNSQGWFSGDNLEEGEQVLCFSGAGYVKKCITVNIRAQENTPLPPVKLPGRGTAVTITNVEGGGTGNDPNTAAQVTFPANSVCDSSGTAVTGDIDCYFTPIDATATTLPDTAPDTFAAIDASNNQGTMESAALMELTCEQNGSEVNICSSKTATVRLPIYSSCADDTRVPNSQDLWYFDETSGNWQLYGTGSMNKTCGADETDSYYQGTIDHMTWINGDKWRDDACLTGVVTLDGSAATGTNITVTCYGSGWRNTVQVGTDGRFCIAVPKGYAYTCNVGDNTGWSSNPITGTASGAIVGFPVASCPATGCEDLGNAFTFASPILTTTFTWGLNPADLDSHTRGSTGTHVWYSDKDNDWTKGSFTSSPYIMLDTDDTTSYGPEVTTVSPQVADGKYCFYVHLFSGTGAINQESTDEFGNPKKATVIVTGDGVAQSFTAPDGNATDYWRVYTVEFSGGGVVSGSFQSVNDYVSSEPTDCNW